MENTKYVLLRHHTIRVFFWIPGRLFGCNLFPNKGPKTIPPNNRPISLLSIMNKYELFRSWQSIVVILNFSKIFSSTLEVQDTRVFISAPST